MRDNAGRRRGGAAVTRRGRRREERRDGGARLGAEREGDATGRAGCGGVGRVDDPGGERAAGIAVRGQAPPRPAPRKARYHLW